MWEVVWPEGPARRSCSFTLEPMESPLKGLRRGAAPTEQCLASRMSLLHRKPGDATPRQAFTVQAHQLPLQKQPREAALPGTTGRSSTSAGSPSPSLQAQDTCQQAKP